MMRFASLVLLVAAAWVGPVSAQPMWQRVTSKEGQFSIETPGMLTINKTRTSKGTGSNNKMLIVGCRSQGATYLAYKVQFSTAVVKGTEEAELDAVQDDLAASWNGKVLSKKKVRAGTIIGREFTVRGKPIEEEGLVTIRVRMYLDRSAIYAVAVLSEPNRELPEDAGRFLGSLVIGAGKVPVAVAPEPEGEGKELKGWGIAFDPSKDCVLRPDAKGLTIQVPGTLHTLNPDVQKMNAPRVLQDVEGDFMVTVKVTGEFKPGGKSTSPKAVPFNGAGILVYYNADNYIRCERSAMLRGGKISAMALFQEREAGYDGAYHNQASPGGDCYLRVERRGSRVSGGISFDGTNWKKLDPIDTLWPERLKVGLMAVNSSSLPFSPRFEEFELKTNKAAPKR